MSVVRLWAGGQTYKAIHRHHPRPAAAAAATAGHEQAGGGSDSLLVADDEAEAAARSSQSSIDMTLVSMDAGDIAGSFINGDINGVIGGPAAAGTAGNASDEYPWSATLQQGQAVPTTLPPVFRVS